MLRSSYILFSIVVPTLLQCSKDSSSSNRSSGGGSQDASGLSGTLSIDVEPAASAEQSSVDGAVMTVVDHPEIKASADETGKISTVAPAGTLQIMVTSNTGGSLTADAAKYGLKLDDVLIEVGEGKDLGKQSLKLTGAFSGTVEAFLEDQDIDLSGTDVFVPGTSFSAKTNDKGAFKLEGLPPGNYSLYVQKDGFATLKRHDLTVLEGKTTDLGILALSLSNGPEGGVSVTPSLTATIAGKSSKIVKSRDVNFQLNYDSEAVLMKISDEPSFLNKEWVPVSKQESWSFESDGSFSIYVMYSDLNGLESSPYSDSFYIDTEAPLISSAKILYNWSTTAGRYNFVDLVASDSGSGIAQFMYKEGDSSFSGAAWLDYSERVEIDIGTSLGAKTIYFKIKDHAGNVSNVINDSITKDTDTWIPSIVDHDVVLFQKQSPFRVKANVTVNGKFEIMPGTQLILDKNNGGMSDEHSKLTVKGPFKAVGTISSLVEIIGDHTTPGDCEHTLDLSFQTNDDISESLIQYASIKDICRIVSVGGVIDHTDFDGVYPFNASSYGLFEKQGTEILSISNSNVQNLTGAGFLFSQSNGGNIVLNSMSIDGGTSFNLFSIADGTTMTIEQSSLSNGSTVFTSMMSGLGTINISNSEISNFELVVKGISSFTATRNDFLDIRLLHDAAYTSNTAVYSRNEIRLTGGNSTTEIADLLAIGGGTLHDITLENNNIDCTGANCRGGILLDVGNAPTTGMSLTFTDNHWTAKAPVSQTAVGSCSSLPTLDSFVICLESTNKYTDYGIAGYNIETSLSGSPSPLWSGAVLGNLTTNAPVNSPAGKP